MIVRFTMCLFCCAAIAGADTFTLDIVLPSGNNAQLGVPLPIEIRGLLTNDAPGNDGLACVTLDVTMSGPEAVNLSQAIMWGPPADQSMDNFAQPLGYDANYSGTGIGDDLVQAGGAQNTFGNNPGQFPNLAFPSAEFIDLNIGHSEQVILEGTITFPLSLNPMAGGDTYTLSVQSILANVLGSGQMAGSFGVYAVESATGVAGAPVDIVLGGAGAGCAATAECADVVDNDGTCMTPPCGPDATTDDACLWWSCGGGTCSNDPTQPCDADSDCGAGNSCTLGAANACTSFALVEPSDMGGPFNNCEPDGFCNNADANQALLCFATASPCESINIDAGGPFGDCAPDGFCNLFDANHALACFATDNPCNCTGGPSPTIAPSIASSTSLTAKADSKRVSPGSRVSFDVFTDAAIGKLSGYQLHAQISGGDQGQLELVDIVIDDRRDHVFAGAHGIFESFNVANGQMLAGLFDESVSTKASGYLATFVYSVSPRASGTFVFDVLHDSAIGDQTFFVGATDRDKIRIAGTNPAVVVIANTQKLSRR